MALSHRALVGGVGVGGLALRLLERGDPGQMSFRRGLVSPLPTAAEAERGRRAPASARSTGTCTSTVTSTRMTCGAGAARGPFGFGRSFAPPAGGYGRPVFAPLIGIVIAGFFAGLSDAGW